MSSDAYQDARTTVKLIELLIHGGGVFGIDLNRSVSRSRPRRRKPRGDSDATVERIRSLHGEPMRPPISAALEVSVEYIRRHREPDQGGVFRQPALTLPR